MEAIAVSAASGIIGSLAEKAGSAILGKTNSVPELPDEISKLQRTFQMIAAFLGDAEKQQSTNPAVRVWLDGLKDLAYDADDLLDEYLTAEALRSRRAEEGRSIVGCMKQVSAHTSSYYKDVARKVVVIRNSLDTLDRDRTSLGLTFSSSEKESTPWKAQGTSSLTDENFVGRDKEKNEIIRQLLCESGGSSSGGGNKDKVSLIPIVGMGGMGKTTLAQEVFNDSRVISHFPRVRKWVSVGKTFNACEVITKIMGRRPRDRDGNEIKDPTLEDFHSALVTELGNERFLIVLDDVWSEEKKEWDNLWKPLTRG